MTAQLSLFAPKPAATPEPNQRPELLPEENARLLESKARLDAVLVEGTRRNDAMMGRTTQAPAPQESSTPKTTAAPLEPPAPGPVAPKPPPSGPPEDCLLSLCNGWQATRLNLCGDCPNRTSRGAPPQARRPTDCPYPNCTGAGRTPDPCHDCDHRRRLRSQKP